MKKYIKPKSREIDLALEGDILNSSTLEINREEATGEALSKYKDMWGNEDIWK